jgi:hypothetical protein
LKPEFHWIVPSFRNVWAAVPAPKTSLPPPALLTVSVYPEASCQLPANSPAPFQIALPFRTAPMPWKTPD